MVTTMLASSTTAVANASAVRRLRGRPTSSAAMTGTSSRKLRRPSSCGRRRTAPITVACSSVVRSCNGPRQCAGRARVVERAAQPPVPRARREQLALVGSRLQILRRRPREHGEQQGIINDEHESGFVSLQVGELGILRHHGVGEPSIRAVAQHSCDRCAFLLAEWRLVWPRLRLQLSGRGQLLPGAVNRLLQRRIEMHRSDGHESTICARPTNPERCCRPGPSHAHSGDRCEGPGSSTLGEAGSRCWTGCRR